MIKDESICPAARVHLLSGGGQPDRGLRSRRRCAQVPGRRRACIWRWAGPGRNRLPHRRADRVHPSWRLRRGRQPPAGCGTLIPQAGRARVSPGEEGVRWHPVRPAVARSAAAAAFAGPLGPAASARDRRSCRRSRRGRGARHGGRRTAGARGSGAPRPGGGGSSASARGVGRRSGRVISSRIGRPCAVVEPGSVRARRGQGKAGSPLAGSPPARRNPGGQAVSYLWGEESRRTSCICLISQR